MEPTKLQASVRKR